MADLQSGGCGFESRPGLLRTKVYTAFHPSVVGKWVPAAAGKAKAGMAHSDCGWTCGCAGKTVKSLENTCLTWALLRWCFTTKRRYIKCMYLYLLPLPSLSANVISNISCLLIRVNYKVKITSCRRAAATICPRPSPPSVGAEAPRAAERTPSPADGNVAVGCHAQYVPTLTAAAAWCLNAAVSKATWWPWPLTFWPWNWWQPYVTYMCPNHVWRGLPLCQF